MRSGRLLCLTFIALLSASNVAFSEEIKFSPEEIALLKRLNQIQVGAGVSRTMLKAAPFLQIASSTSRSDMLITIQTSDWDQIFGALKGLKKIEACTTVQAIEMWKDVDGNEFSNTRSKSFFGKIQSKASNSCSVD